jgi:hypothetical protein
MANIVSLLTTAVMHAMEWKAAGTGHMANIVPVNGQILPLIYI